MAPIKNKVEKAYPKSIQRKSRPESLKNVSGSKLASDSDVDFSSDEENFELKGLTEKSANNVSGHTVNFYREAPYDSLANSQNTRGTLFVGSLPKSFQQYELKKYFSQFGEITRVRLLKDKKTGKSRGYGFVEFKVLSSAEIAAETMDNYLLAGTNMKVQILKNHADNLFSSKMKSSFGEFDWRSKESAEYNAPKPSETWKELQLQFEENKKAKFEELRKAGFNYALEA